MSPRAPLLTTSPSECDTVRGTQGDKGREVGVGERDTGEGDLMERDFLMVKETNQERVADKTNGASVAEVIDRGLSLSGGSSASSEGKDARSQSTVQGVEESTDAKVVAPAGLSPVRSHPTSSSSDNKRE